MPLAACATSPEMAPPEILGARATAGTENVLSAIVTVELRNADSVAVRYSRAEVATLNQTPVQIHSPYQTEVLLLGLEPEVTYRLEVLAWRGAEMLVRDIGSVTTRALPDDLPSYQASGDNPTPGFVAFAAGAYGLVIDNTGRVVWYHRFPNGPGLNFMGQPNGRYVARPATPPISSR